MIGIVTESLSCMTAEDTKKFNCTVLPAYCIVDNKKIPDSIEQYKYGNKRVSARSPSATDFYNAFCELARTTQDIICITSSAKMTPSYENAVIAAKACPQARIKVIDSCSTAGSMIILADLCRRLEESGIGFTDIVNILEKQKNNIYTNFSPKSFLAMKASIQTGTIAHDCPTPILNQRPICFFDGDGRIVMKKIAHGTLNMVRQLLEEHKERTPRTICIHYSEKNMVLGDIINAVSKAFPDATIIERRLSHAIRANTGDNTISIISHSM